MKIRAGPEICERNYEAPGWILCVGALVRPCWCVGATERTNTEDPTGNFIVFSHISAPILALILGTSTTSYMYRKPVYNEISLNTMNTYCF